MIAPTHRTGDLRPCSGAPPRELSRNRSVGDVQRAIEDLDTALQSHNLLVDPNAPPEERARFSKVFTIATQLGLAVDKWSGM